MKPPSRGLAEERIPPHPETGLVEAPVYPSSRHTPWRGEPQEPPLQRVPASRPARAKKVGGREEGAADEPGEQTLPGFEAAWEELGEQARLLMAVATFFQPGSVPRSELRDVLTGEGGWTPKEFENALEQCVGPRLLVGEEVLRGHEVLWDVIRENQSRLRAGARCDRRGTRRRASRARDRRLRGDRGAARARRPGEGGGGAASRASRPR